MRIKYYRTKSFMYKKFRLFLPLITSFFIIWGCEKKYDNILDADESKYSVTVSSAPFFNTVDFNPEDSAVVIYIGLNNTSVIKDVWVDIFSSENKKLNSSPFYLFDNGENSTGDKVKGDGVYSNRFPFSQYYPNGDYRIEFYYSDTRNFIANILRHGFVFDNQQENFPPVISNLSVPDTAFIGSTIQLIYISIDVYDQNGLNDIEMVYFNSFIPPNGNPSQSNPFKLYDDGKADHGDLVAGDGRFSTIVQLPTQGVTTGQYRWEFEAKDRGKKLSNKIIHFITIL